MKLQVTMEILPDLAAAMCVCKGTRNMTELGHWDHCPLEGGRHTEFVICRCDACHKIYGFPNSNLKLALQEGTAETKTELREIIMKGNNALKKGQKHET